MKKGELLTIDDIYALPDGERAELIDGKIYYMATPSRTHQRISVICDQSKLDEKGCHGALDWIIEIVSSGNKSMDYLKNFSNIRYQESKNIGLLTQQADKLWYIILRKI